MNLVLLLSAVGWAAAQTLKVLISLVWDKELDLKRILSSGGMPSSHAATVCACTTSVGLRQGFTSPLFGAAAVFSFIVMYDAANVRRETGEQSKVLNYMMQNWQEEGAKPDFFAKQMKELVGHTPLQVVVGSLLGIAIGWFGCLIAGE